MSGGRFPMDLSTGMTDLCWNLVMFFFLCTMVLARPTIGALPGLAPDREGAGEPAVVTVREVGPGALRTAEVTAAGAFPAPTVDEGLVAWLGRVCGVGAPPVVLVCPDEASHRECQRIAGEFVAAAPVCNVQY